MRTDHAQSDWSIEPPPPYPKWWDMANGAVVSLIALATAAGVLMWMVGMMFSA